MAMRQQGNHWGLWIKARSRVVGILTYLSLARAAGCTGGTISRLTTMDMPPNQMRDGLDGRLCFALRTDRVTLFNTYRSVKASDAPILNGSEAEAAARLSPLEPTKAA
jgi:hypothetical protein